MAISRDELVKKINSWRKNKSINLSDDYLDYLNSYIEPKNISVFATDDTGKELDDYTPEFEAAQAKVLGDLGLSNNEIDEIMGNPVTSKVVIDKDDDGDADITVTKQDDGNDDESLIIGGTDIFKEPFSEEQLAILRGDDDYNKFSKDEFNSLQAADYPKARTARKAWIKRARELLDGNDDKPSDKPHDQGLTGDTTIEEELTLKPDMSPTEFSKKAAEKRGAKPGEPAPDMNFTNSIARTLASRRW